MDDLKESIIARAKKIEDKEHLIDFLTFVKDMGIKCTENANGVFINLNSLDKKVLASISEKIDSIKKN